MAAGRTGRVDIELYWELGTLHLNCGEGFQMLKDWKGICHLEFIWRVNKHTVNEIFEIWDFIFQTEVWYYVLFICMDLSNGFAHAWLNPALFLFLSLLN